MNEAVIVSAVRTPVGKAPKGSLRTVRPETLAVTAIKAALERAPGLDPVEIDDLYWGCAFPEGEQGLNVGRYIGLLAGLPESVPGVTVNRFCSSGLQAIAFGAQAIMSGMTEEVTNPTEISRLDGLDWDSWAPGHKAHWMRIRAGTVSGRRIVLPPEEVLGYPTA